jgi:DeoD family purine-nucleoside phosphorylase
VRDLIHIHQTARLAERVLLPGDPGRALRLAQALLENPKMLNHNRGLWGYTGKAADGHLLSIQSTGMGGPSAAVVVSELVELGARRLLRVGTCGGLDPQLNLGQPLVVTEAIADDGTSVALGGHAPMERVLAPGKLTRALLDAAANAYHAARRPATSGPIVSTDLFYDAEDRVDTWIGRGARAVEMETAAIFTLAARRGVQAGCVLLVSNMLTATAQTGTPEYIAQGELHDAELTLGELALAALSAS